MSTNDPAHIPDFMSMLRLDGCTFVVLGAGLGIGRHVAHALAQAGAQVLCVGRNDEATRQVAGEIGGTACIADINKPEDMRRAFEKCVPDLGKLQGIVNIVGHPVSSPLVQVNEEHYSQQVDAVLKHAWLTVQIGGPLLAEAGGGCITFVGSVAGITTGPSNRALYGAAKAALHHLARYAAVEFGPRGVRVNVVAPGITKTPRVLASIGPDWSQFEQRNPLKRVAMPADIAGAVLFLSSDLARHVTGHTLVADGGATA